jgi:hypothetical protein
LTIAGQIIAPTPDVQRRRLLYTGRAASPKRRKYPGPGRAAVLGLGGRREIVVCDAGFSGLQEQVPACTLELRL